MAGKRGSGSWSYVAIQSMVRRDRYRGLLVWGKKKKAYKGGTKVRVDRPEADWVRIEVPELRIVDDELWNAVRARDKHTERVTGDAHKGNKARYLLSGIGRCAECGGPMRVDNGKSSYENLRVYNCAWHRDRGKGACGNGLRRPISAVDATIIRWIQENVLREEVIVEALAELRRRLTARAKSADTTAPELEREAKKLRGDITRLGEAIMSTTEAPTTLVRMMGEREKRLTAVEARLATIRTAPEVLDLEVQRMEKDALARLEDFRGMMTRNQDEARKALETLLTGPLKFTPVETEDGKRYQIEGDLALEAIVVAERRVVQTASPAGFGTLGHRPVGCPAWRIFARFLPLVEREAGRLPPLLRGILPQPGPGSR
jgi:hypothetical protein